MKLPIRIVDAFCSGPFTGNPAAVCPLEGDWLDDAMLQGDGVERQMDPPRSDQHFIEGAAIRSGGREQASHLWAEMGG